MLKVNEDRRTMDIAFGLGPLKRFIMYTKMDSPRMQSSRLQKAIVPQISS